MGCSVVPTYKIYDVTEQAKKAVQDFVKEQVGEQPEPEPNPVMEPERNDGDIGQAG